MKIQLYIRFSIEFGGGIIYNVFIKSILGGPMNKNRVNYIYLGITLLVGIVTGIIMFSLQKSHYDFESYSFNVVKTQLIPLKLIIGVFVAFLFIRPVITKETVNIKTPS